MATSVIGDKFNAVNEGISPFPVDDRPIDVLSLVHVYVVLPSVFGVVNSIIEEISLLHSTTSSTLSISGDGLTVIVNVSALPSQKIPLFS